MDSFPLSAFSQVLMSHCRMHSDCVCVCRGRTEAQRYKYRVGSYDRKLVVGESVR